MKDSFPEEYNGFLSETFFYPENKTFLEEKFKNYNINVKDLWLVKPKHGSLGNGIHLFEGFEKTKETDFLLTKYITYPHLLYGYKYDFRVYVLVTGIAPLKIYLYKEGLTRISSEKYSLDEKDFKDNYKHLTNVSLNKKNEGLFKIASDVDTEEGNRWSLTAYENYCKKNGIIYENIREQMRDLTIKIILSVHKEYLEEIQKNKLETRNFFQMSGLDFMLDENLRLFFIEANDRPSVYMGDINDRKLKPQLIADVLNIVGITPYSHDYKENFRAYESKEEKKEYKEGQNESEDERILRDVEESICEIERPKGNFELVFPLKNNIDKYKKLFRVNLKENELFWQKIKEMDD